jgi:hypothetical protein
LGRAVLRDERIGSKAVKSNGIDGGGIFQGLKMIVADHRPRDGQPKDWGRKIGENLVCGVNDED